MKTKLNTKFILQVYRHMLWEDILKFKDFSTAYFYLKKIRDEGFICRLVEVCVL